MGSGKKSGRAKRGGWTPRPSGEVIRVPRWAVQIPNWKELGVTQFSVQLTYLGVLEGQTESINRMILKDMPARVGGIFCGKRKAGVIPVHVELPKAVQMNLPFPDYLCMALVTSTPVEKPTLTPDSLWSQVVCCFFANDINRTPEVLMQEGIRPFAWDDVAENCEW